MRIAIVSFVANLLGVQFKIGGLPHGASYERSKWMHPATECNWAEIAQAVSECRTLNG